MSTETEIADELCKKLERTTRRLRRILRDRIEVPTDRERVRDLSAELLEGHRLLTTMYERYGDEE